MSESFDVAIIGAGPGGYVAAIRCAQLGLNAVCIDDWKNEKGKASLGGTCLNVGCIPSKALLESSDNFYRAINKFSSHGIKIADVSVDVPTMIARKDKIVTMFTSGIASLFKKNKITSIHGKGTLLKREENDRSWKIEIKDTHEVKTVQARYVILATGSIPRPLPIAPIDNKLILDNAGALALTEIPSRLGVIGAGVIGLEMGSVWRRLGSEVTILEAAPEFLMAADEQIAKEAQKIFSKEPGLLIKTGVKITAVDTRKKDILVEYTDAGNNPQKLEIDKLIIAVGRTPNTAGLGAERNGLKLDERGYIIVDHFCQTNLPNVYAVGDVVRGPMLAHKASEEGVSVAEAIIAKEKGQDGESQKVHLDTIPWVIYTSPEIAWVGKTEQELKTMGINYKTGQFPFIANGRARAMGETNGFIKVLADETSDRILGVHMIGPHVSELISEAVTAMEFSATSQDIACIVHAHPSLSEVLHEAALGVDKRALHI
ncbi:dihydrolipoamide dehydrogenase [Nitrosomonas cryotolerans]|uniref:Dihydrolipoyl dehydrogenase n=1 Tax=Nitrosomonas cryotolerans ATCC 49181 TaxID=1131553 RepID=A0A1N6ILR6_9PROT|nr:dihydrolipoyl dehydrogenase [Nitrosomonas cryotolerans]SFP37015.1 dihydrolipoamide dehydrogenase [Nitrosomonas cryotolerans]SIO32951.1 dihydrolipoamide dehydrogenase [Nitrosomonas cryotolerans ATCC 49181]